jgi:hypothetical protein
VNALFAGFPPDLALVPAFCPQPISGTRVTADDVLRELHESKFRMWSGTNLETGSRDLEMT